MAGSHADITTGPKGEIANRKLIEHSKQFKPTLYKINERVYSLVGEGLSNAALILGDGGAIVVDSGESIEEASEHLAEFRKITDLPIKAVIYSHSHYCRGTQAYQDDAGEPIQVWAHERVPTNIVDVAGEIGPAFTRRLMIHFGYFLPQEGPDAMPNYGLGPYFFHPSGRRATGGYLPPTHVIGKKAEATIAGIKFEFIEYSSDSDDTIIINLPEENIVINNHIWPCMFNIYTLRGGPYRDPLEHVEAIDCIRQMDPMHLVNVHGVPIMGRDNVDRALQDYRDSLQFIWDQTVRGINRNLAQDDLVDFVQLPKHLEDSPYIQQFYGEVPFHVRAVHSGLFGWFGNDCATLLPVSPDVEAEKIVIGFGGRDKVLADAKAALSNGEENWAAQLVGYLVRLDPNDEEAKQLKANALRLIGQTST
ncbi:MAG: alkyl/aryl-sulfatase, partial [Pseudomonadota bacterium]